MESKKRSILVVEDEPGLADLLDYILKEEGYHVRLASSAETAMALIRQEPPDMILLDLILPGVDGMEICRRVRANQATAEVPIIIITAKSDARDRQKALDAGADDYMLKPADTAELKSRIASLLKSRASGGGTA